MRWESPAFEECSRETRTEAAAAELCLLGSEQGDIWVFLPGGSYSDLRMAGPAKVRWMGRLVRFGTRSSSTKEHLGLLSVPFNCVCPTR